VAAEEDNDNGEKESNHCGVATVASGDLVVQFVCSRNNTSYLQET
jgi:hypothetical protein